MLDTHLDIPAFLDRRPFIGTYTNLHTFRDVCEYQAYRRYVKKDIPFFETEAMKFGKDAHTALEKRVGKGQVLPDNMRQWDKHCTQFDKYEVMTEQKLAVNSKGQPTGYFDNDVFFRGQADVVVMLNEKALFTDWKSGNPRYADKFELETGALLLKAKYPQLRTIAGRFIFLKDDVVGKMEDLSDFQATWLEINRLMNLVAEKRQSEDWEKEVGTLRMVPVQRLRESLRCEAIMHGPEYYEKKAIKKYLVSLGAWFFSPYMAGFGKSGVPDIVACINGKFVSIEVKRESKEPTALQWQRMAEIDLAGGFTCWGTAARVIPLLKNLNA